MGFILKQQDLGEADLLLTFFADESGKIRVLVKSAKKMTSRLAGRLQPAALIKLTTVGNTGLVKVIGAEIIESYPDMLSSQEKIHALLAMQELAIRSLADGQTSNELFSLYKMTLQELANGEERNVPRTLVQFFVGALQALGFSPKPLEDDVDSGQIFLSFSEGKFDAKMEHTSDRAVSSQAYRIYKSLFSGLGDTEPDASGYYQELLTVLSDFAGYVLERELRSARYFS